MTDQEGGMIMMMMMRKRNKINELKMKRLNNILTQNEFNESKELVEKYSTTPIKKMEKSIEPKLMSDGEKVKKYDDFVNSK